jgi:hypothetical protein
MSNDGTRHTIANNQFDPRVDYVCPRRSAAGLDVCSLSTKTAATTGPGHLTVLYGIGQNCRPLPVGLSQQWDAICKIQNGGLQKLFENAHFNYLASVESSNSPVSQTTLLVDG